MLNLTSMLIITQKMIKKNLYYFLIGIIRIYFFFFNNNYDHVINVNNIYIYIFFIQFLCG